MKRILLFTMLAGLSYGQTVIRVTPLPDTDGTSLIAVPKLATSAALAAVEAGLATTGSVAAIEANLASVSNVADSAWALAQSNEVVKADAVGGTVSNMTIKGSTTISGYYTEFTGEVEAFAGFHVVSGAFTSDANGFFYNDLDVDGDLTVLNWLDSRGDVLARQNLNVVGVISNATLSNLGGQVVTNAATLTVATNDIAINAANILSVSNDLDTAEGDILVLQSNALTHVLNNNGTATNLTIEANLAINRTAGGEALKIVGQGDGTVVYQVASDSNLFEVVYADEGGDYKVGTGYLDDEGAWFLYDYPADKFAAKASGGNFEVINDLAVGGDISVIGGSLSNLSYISTSNEVPYRIGGDSILFCSTNAEIDVVLVGHNAGLNNTNSDIVFVGTCAGENNTGKAVVGIGEDTLFENSGSFTVAMGEDAGYQNTSDNGVFIGHNAGRLNTAQYLTAVGRTAGSGNAGTWAAVFGNSAGRDNEGDNVAFFGREAGRLNTGDDVIGIGYRQGYQNTNNNRLFIDTVANGTNALIYGEFDNDLIRINGDLEVTGTVSGVGSGLTGLDLTPYSVTALSDVTDAGSGAIITTNERVKLSGIEALADVTDAANVESSGAVMTNTASYTNALLDIDTLLAQAVSNLFAFNTTNDLPAPTSDPGDGGGFGYRPLVTGKWNLGASLSLPYPIILANNVGMVLDGNAFPTLINTSATNAMFIIVTNSPGSFFQVQNINLAGNGTNICVDLRSGVFARIKSTVSNFGEVGTMKNLALAGVNKAPFFENKKGLVFTNTAIVSMLEYSVVNTGSYGNAAFEFHGNISSIRAVSGEISMGTNDYAFLVSSNLTGRGSFDAANILSAKAPFDPAGLDETSPQMSVRDSTGIPESVVRVSGGAADQGGVSTPLDQDVWHRIVATYHEDSLNGNPLNQRMSVSTNGTIYYEGLEGVTESMAISLFGRPSGAGSATFKIGFARGNTNVSVASFADLGGGQIQATTTAAHGYHDGDPVLIEDAFDYNGSPVATNTTSLTFDFADTYTSNRTASCALVVTHSSHPNQYRNELDSVTSPSQIPLFVDSTLIPVIVNITDDQEFETHDIQVVN